MQNLTRLDWSFTSITNEGLDFVCRSCPNLEKLKLRFCKFLSNVAMGKSFPSRMDFKTYSTILLIKYFVAASISKYLSKLKLLRVDKCVQIDDQGISDLFSESLSASLTLLSLKEISMWPSFGDMIF
jgi:hypothetical protein